MLKSQHHEPYSSGDDEYLIERNLNSTLIDSLVKHIFPSGSEWTDDISGEDNSERYFIIPGNNGPRWIVPNDPIRIHRILAAWRPYDWHSNIKWKMIIGAYRLGVLKSLPGITTAGITQPRGSDWTHLGWRHRLPPDVMIYVGSPGAARKAVVTLVGKDDNTCLVAKVPLGPLAANCIAREYQVLDELSQERPGYAPTPIYFDKAREIAVQSYVGGRQTGIAMSSTHVEWLAGLQEGGLIRTTEEIVSELSSQLARCNGLLAHEWEIGSLILRTVDRSVQFTSGWVHGDFAPWNLRWVGEGRLTAVDWEFASQHGFSGIDIVHYFRKMAILRRRPFTSELEFEAFVAHNCHRLGLEQFATPEAVRTLVGIYRVWNLVNLAGLGVKDESFSFRPE